MKKTIVLAALAAGILAVNSYGQGKVSFNLSSLSPIPFVTNGVTGANLQGNTWRAQLFYGNSGTAGSTALAASYAPVWSAVSGTVSTPFANFLIPGVVNDNATKYTDPAVVAGGATGYFQVRAWASVLGADWATAYGAWQASPADNAKLLGWSTVIKINAVADNNASPPPTPSSLAGLTSFGVFPVPEPSVLALGVLGLAALLWRRRQ